LGAFVLALKKIVLENLKLFVFAYSSKKWFKKYIF